MPTYMLFVKDENHLAEVYKIDNTEIKSLNDFKLTSRYDDIPVNSKTVTVIDTVFDALSLRPRSDLIFFSKLGYHSLKQLHSDTGSITTLRDSQVLSGFTNIITVPFEFYGSSLIPMKNKETKS